MKHDKSNVTERRPYEPPKLLLIELAADEVLADNCKTATGSTGMSPPSCIVSTCWLIGS